MSERYEIEDDGCDVLIDGHDASDRAAVHIHDAFRQCLADIAERDARISELTTAMQRQANAVKMIDMSRVARAEALMQHAQVLYDLSRPDELESLRQANAILTADVERAESELARLRAQEPRLWLAEPVGGDYAGHFPVVADAPGKVTAYAASFHYAEFRAVPLYAEPMPAKDAK